MAARLVVFWPRAGSFRNVVGKLQGKSPAWIRIQRNSSSYKQELQEIEKHAQETYLNWKNVSLFVAIPVCSYLFYKHMIVGEHMEKPTEFVAYPHIRIRSKPFPWGDGDKSLFHNAEYNVGPDTEFNEETEEAKEEKHIPFLTRFIMRFQEPAEESHAWRDDHLRKCRQSALENMERKRKPNLPLIPFDVVELFDKQKKPTKMSVDD